MTFNVLTKCLRVTEVEPCGLLIGAGQGEDL